MYQNRSTRTREEANQMNMEAPSSDDDQESNQRRRKRTYRRHTQQQIDEMDT